MIVVLHVKRTSGETDVHELPAVGDFVEVPVGLLSGEDVLGFDIELVGTGRYDFDIEVVDSRHAGRRDARSALD